MSAKKHVSGSAIKGLLLEGHFGKSSELQPRDPVTPTHMHLEIARIKPYDHNPRRLQNPMYAQIRASILKKQGLDDPISITRRPGEDRYTVRAGGNTRLSILKDLLQETENPAFSRAYCLFVPWVSESDCITAHLIENELRGALILIDKAVALKTLFQQIEAEAGGALTRSDFVRCLAEMGYPISRRQLIRYEYAADVLEPLIPEALDTGLGGRQIDEIKEAAKHYSDYWQSCGLETDQFDPVFRSSLSENDSDAWNLKDVLDALELRIAEKTGKTVNAVRLAVDEWIAGVKPHSRHCDGSGRSVASEPPAHRPVQSIEDQHAAKTTAPESQTDGTDPVHIPADKDETSLVQRIESDRKEAEHRGLDRQEPILPDALPRDGDEDQEDQNEAPVCDFLVDDLNNAGQQQAAVNDLKSLRARACILAMRIAQSIECNGAIRPYNRGYGFFVDLPDPSIKNQNEEVRWGWWLLFALSEQAITPARLQLRPADARLPKDLTVDRLEESFDRIGPPPKPFQNLGHDLFSSPRLSERAFKDCLLLIETCRTLRNQFSEARLWPGPTHDSLSQGDSS